MTKHLDFILDNTEEVPEESPVYQADIAPGDWALHAEFNGPVPEFLLIRRFTEQDLQLVPTTTGIDAEELQQAVADAEEHNGYFGMVYSRENPSGYVGALSRAQIFPISEPRAEELLAVRLIPELIRVTCPWIIDYMDECIALLSDNLKVEPKRCPECGQFMYVGAQCLAGLLLTATETEDGTIELLGPVPSEAPVVMAVQHAHWHCSACGHDVHIDPNEHNFSTKHLRA